MKKRENIKEMLKSRIKELDRQIFDFNPALHVTYSAFDAYLDENYKALTIHAYAFMPSRVLKLNSDAYYEMFKHWAWSLDFEQIPEYIQLKDEREQTYDWLNEVTE